MKRIKIKCREKNALLPAADNCDVEFDFFPIPAEPAAAALPAAAAPARPPRDAS